MSRTTENSWNVKLGIVVFLAAQLFSVAHATEFGAAPHEHDGFVCLASLSEGQDDLVVATQLAAPQSVEQSALIIRLVEQEVAIRLRSVRPPSTGPPSI